MDSLTDQAWSLVRSLWRGRWLALGVAWGLALAGWLVVSLVPNAYEARAKLVVQPQALLPSAVSSGQQQADLDAVRQRLTSPENLQAIVRATALREHVASPRDVADKAVELGRGVKIVAQPDNLYEITARVSERDLSDRENARLAKDVVDRLLAQFRDGNLVDGRRETGQSLAFLDGQIEARGRQLADIDAKRAAFESRYLSGLPGTGSVADRLAQARMELSRIETDLSSAQSALSAVNGQMAGTAASTRVPGVAMAAAPDPSAGRVAAIEGQIAEGQSRGWTDQHPDMVALRGQLSRVRAQAHGGAAARMTAGSSTPNPMYLSLRSMQAERQAQVSALAARRGQLQAQINGVVSQQAGNPAFVAQETALDRDAQALRAQYDKLLADREDVRLRSQVQAQPGAVRFQLLEAPVVSGVPAKPNRPLLLTLVLLGAVVGGAATAFAHAQFKPGFADPDRLAAAIGLPVIGTVSDHVPPIAAAQRRRRVRQFAGGAAALAGLWAVLMIVEFASRSLLA